MILQANSKNVKVAAQVVKRGGIIAFQTDTVYGLGCDPFNIFAVKNLVQIKARESKPFPVLVSSLSAASKIAHVTPLVETIATKFWPGPLTLVTKKKKELPWIVTFGRRTVGVRQPRHETLSKLLASSGGLLIGTSANKSGRPPCMTALEVARNFNDAVSVILDGGRCDSPLTSTVVQVTANRLTILREGAIPFNHIRKALDLSREGD